MCVSFVRFCRLPGLLRDHTPSIHREPKGEGHVQNQSSHKQLLTLPMLIIHPASLLHTDINLLRSLY